MSIPKRPVMTLFSSPDDIYSHQVRLVLAEKAVPVDIVEVDLEDPPEKFVELGTYHTLPALVDRDLVIYKARIIMDYLDERFPHPPLLPVYPIAKAKLRIMMHRMEEDWYSQFELMKTAGVTRSRGARKILTENLTKVAPAFEKMEFCFSNEFSLVDCWLLPLLWRLDMMKITLPDRAAPLLKYANRLFSRDAFQISLTDVEREMQGDEF